MRVLFLSMWYPNQENPVFGTFVHEQAVALRNCGVDVRIVQPIPFAPFPLGLFSARYAALAKIPARETHEGFEVYHPRYLTLPHHLRFDRVGDWMFAGVKKTVEEIHAEWPFDVIHAHATFPCGYAANRLRDESLPGVKVVHTIHRTCIVDAPGYSAACRRKVTQSLDEADAGVFVASEGLRLANDLTEGRMQARSHYVTNGVNTEKFSLAGDDEVVLARLKAEHVDSWNLVFVGYLNQRKGMYELLPAVARLVRAGHTRLRLFLVGRNELGGYIADFVREHGLEDNVVLVGSVHHSQVKHWMHFADAFVLPSHSEGLPTVLFESLFSGTPAIFTRVGGIADVVEDGEHALLIEPKSTDAICAAIERLMEDAALRDRLSRQGHALIRDHYTWQLNAERHVELYASLLDGAGS
ncbi:MAG: glycosyltransferase [Rhodocyclaceae bacterium]|nr:glycosyltransferase [Rhodocyclaceae bacterium]